MPADEIKRNSLKGLGIGVFIMLLWGTCLVYWLTREISSVVLWGIPGAIFIQAFLYTGLFITAHDAMHGSVFPRWPVVNKWIGTLAVLLYALFSYKKLLKKHWEHHRHPTGEADPDFHDGEHGGFWRWYLRFMIGYLSWKQFLGMAIVYNLLKHLCQIPDINLILIWILPSLLSTLQLFYFGTYLPHRQLNEAYRDEHCTRSNDYSVFWSFITCYHFGYHWEHHAYPGVPWWLLPNKRKESLRGSTR